jgi:lysyl-tRNA synthetase class 2
MADDEPWHILSSSVLRAVSYNESSRELRVRFTNGSVYRYHRVPPRVAATLLDPPDSSSGRYFNETIRDGFDFDEEKR